MSPLFETEEDVENEYEVISKLKENAFRGATRSKKLPMSYNLDFMLMNDAGEALAFIEIKTRTNASTAYPTIILSMNKFLKAREIYNNTGVPCFLVVNYTDTLKAIDLSEKPAKIELAGRYDRGRKADNEPIVHYNCGDLMTICFHEQPRG